VLPGLLIAALLVTACGEAPASSPAPATPSDPGAVSLSPPPSDRADDTPQSRGSSAVAAPALRSGGSAWSAVSVATLWRSPDAPRDVDRPALTRPAQISKWLADMTLTERRGLNGIADTQALLGDRVRILRLRPHWAKVAVPSQPTPLHARGYPGWVPRRQLTAVGPVRTPRTATVTKPTAWLRTDDSAATKVFRTSFGPRLPIAETTPAFLRVHLPDGTVGRISKTAVVRHDTDEPAFTPARISLVDRARSLVGLEYLWAGTSGFGVDCSGLTWLTYRVHGVRIPRDASAQWAAGTKVTRRLRGDLLFFGDPVRHVGIYAGKATMVHAPGTGETVKVTSTSIPPYTAEYRGARRLLP
jgi:gamma-D-glutamyl-L-lysine dipeptidyl-peptidase